jgi:phospholipase/lecithinase/hemolysin
VNPDTYLFWDQLHPTTYTDYLIAQQAYSLVIPEPSAASMLPLIGVPLLLSRGAARRRCAL